MIAITPSDNHVLCGRGKVHMRHPGNIKFANIIQRSLDEYIQAPSRMERAIEVAKVASFCDDCGLRFIKFNNTTNQYTELSSEQIHDKVSHAIRDHIKKKNKSSGRASTVYKKRTNKSSCSIPEPDMTACSPKSHTERISSTIFELGAMVEKINGNDDSNIFEDFSSWEDAFSFLKAEESWFPLPLSITSRLDIAGKTPTLSPEKLQYDPLPVDHCPKKSLEFESQDVQRLCTILGQEEQVEQGDPFSDLCAELMMQ